MSGTMMREIVLPITGMTCANCAATVERALRRTPGVEGAEVNFATERAVVRIADDEATKETLVQAVERVGYGVLEAEGPDAPDAEARGDFGRLVRKVLNLLGTTHPFHVLRAAEIRRQSRLFWTGVVFSLPLLLLAMARDLGALGPWAHQPWVNWLMFAMAAPVQFYVGLDYYVGGWKALRNRTANMDVLVALGSSTAFLYSVPVTVGLTLGTTALGEHRTAGGS